MSLTVTNFLWGIYLLTLSYEPRVIWVEAPEYSNQVCQDLKADLVASNEYRVVQCFPLGKHYNKPTQDKWMDGDLIFIFWDKPEEVPSD